MQAWTARLWVRVKPYAGGVVVGRNATKGAKPTDVAFGVLGEKKIYVTQDEYGALEAIHVGTDGLPLYR